jgi:hypothetical protein
MEYNFPEIGSAVMSFLSHSNRTFDDESKLDKVSNDFRIKNLKQFDWSRAT